MAVFKYPGDQGQGANRTDYIKRIVGLPGDRIQMTNGMLYINGKPVERLPIGDYVSPTATTRRARSTPRPCQGRRYEILETTTTACPTTRRNSSCRPATIS